jgi:hypothetical protein
MRVAVARDHPGAVVDQIVAEDRVQVPFRDRHADGHGEALAERAGGRLDPLQHKIFGVARARRIQLPEIADLLDRRMAYPVRWSSE